MIPPFRTFSVVEVFLLSTLFHIRDIRHEDNMEGNCSCADDAGVYRYRT